MMQSIREGQYFGALMITIAALVIYTGRLLDDHDQSFRLSLPWGDQGKDMIAVELMGFRKADGVYFFQKKTTLQDVFKATGIEIKRPVLGDLTLIEAIGITAVDGTVAIGGMNALRRLSLGLPIDVNLASAEELARIPGIGEKMADQIIQLRKELGKFKNLSDLTSIAGIKDNRLINLRKYLTVGSTPLLSPER